MSFARTGPRLVTFSARLTLHLVEQHCIPDTAEPGQQQALLGPLLSGSPEENAGLVEQGVTADELGCGAPAPGEKGFAMGSMCTDSYALLHDFKHMHVKLV